MNYRHHADLCHAYHLLAGNGVPESNIITMLYDDVANSTDNPFPFQLFNRPSGGDPGVDVYAGCKKSYTGASVTAANVLAVLTGNASAVSGGGSGEVLNSTADDDVFFAFFDHGASGLVAMPVGPYLYANDLLAAFAQMKGAGMYRRLAVYIEACESGSMLADLPTDANIYATTASDPNESSWGWYCPGQGWGGDVVEGKDIGSCLGDLYSVSWMEDADEPGMIRKQTLQSQYEAVRDRTNLSHVMQYGELDWADTTVIGEFMGNVTTTHSSPPLPFLSLSASRLRGVGLGGSASALAVQRRAAAAAAAAAAAPHFSGVDSRHASLASLRALAARGSAPAAAQLAKELRTGEVFARAFARLSAAMGDAPAVAADPALAHLARVTQWACYKAANAAVEASACGRYTDLTLRYARTTARLCEASGGDASLVSSMVGEACAAAEAEVRAPAGA
jgi:glycosylphosphatidylinositol transamidase (GPIT) subunit GPI8